MLRLKLIEIISNLKVLSHDVGTLIKYAVLSLRKSYFNHYNLIAWQKSPGNGKQSLSSYKQFSRFKYTPALGHNHTAAASDKSYKLVGT